MKTLLKIFGIMLLFAVTGCSSSYYSTGTDDVYYIPQATRGEGEQPHPPEGGKVVEVVNETETIASPASESKAQYNAHYEETGYYVIEDETIIRDVEYHYDENGNQVIVHNHYYGDYYDFSYASRIRRFHRPYVSFGYYDPFFTNMYFYTFNPYYYGVSIYMGYGAAPFYYPSYFWYHPWYSSWYFHPFYWHRPFYHHGFWGWGGSYWHGYHAGFYAGMHYPFGYGHWGWYNYNYNSHDGSNYYYGHRGSMGGNVDRSETGRYTGDTAVDSRQSFAQTFEARTTVNEEGRREVVPERTRVEDTPELKTAQRESISPSKDQAVSSQLSDVSGSAGVRPEQTRAYERAQEIAARAQVSDQDVKPPASRTPRYETPKGDQQERTTVQRYTRPQQVSPQRRTETTASAYTMPRTYTSPSYRQPSTPQGSRTQPAAIRPDQTRPSGQQAAPSRSTQTRPAAQPPSQRPSTQPSRPERGQPTYTPPRQQPSRTTTSPSRTTTPSRSTASPSRSTPSRSTASPSRSTPSRNSGSSSSSSSSSSRSGGRNR